MYVRVPNGRQGLSGILDELWSGLRGSSQEQIAAQHEARHQLASMTAPASTVPSKPSWWQTLLTDVAKNISAGAGQRIAGQPAAVTYVQPAQASLFTPTNLVIGAAVVGGAVFLLRKKKRRR